MIFFECAAKHLHESKKMFCDYRGQASKEFMLEYYGQVKEKTVPEGKEIVREITGSAQDVIDEYCGALRSSMTYMGSKNIKEYHRKAEFRRVTPNFMLESNTRSK